MLAVGLAPAAGLAVLTIVSTWLALLDAPPPLAGLGALALGLWGVGSLIHERVAVRDAARLLWRKHPAALATLFLSVALPCIAMGVAFAGIEVPLSPHDGAAHTEAVEAIRLGRFQSDWYPPGLTAAFAAWLQLLPWVDSARGTFELGLSLPLLAALAVFGLGVAVWDDLTIAAAGALLLGFTYIYPYFPQIWSGWPLAASLILAVGLWTVALEYLDRPSWRLGGLAGILLAAMVLIHGTELYTVGIVLVLVLIGVWVRVPWRTLPRDLGLAAAVALLAAAIYLPSLLHWQEASGAYSLGLGDTQPAQAGASVPAEAGPSSFEAFALSALGIDLPLRLALLAIGAAFAFRQRKGRAVIVVGLCFGGIATTFSFLSGTYAPVRTAYALTYPWSQDYRLFMVVAIAQALVAGAGGTVAVRWLGRQRLRVVRRLSRLLLITWLALMVWATVLFIGYPANLVLGYSTDDAQAMAWLRTHAAADDVVVNDRYADAGIWTPYKAGLSVILPRWGPEAGDPLRRAVVDNITRLDQAPAAAAAACQLKARYVLRGARASAWDQRSFPSLADMRAAPGLEEVFSSGDAAVFRLHLNC
jgi:hypothetical protein